MVDDHPLLRAFIIFDHDDLAHPRILVLYPRHPRLTLRQADTAVDLVVPAEIRGEERPYDSPGEETRRREFSNSTYVTYDLAGKKNPRVRRIEIVGNGIQGLGWDPIALLQNRGAGA